MLTTVLDRWEDLRELTTGPKAHLRSVADYLQGHPAVLYHGDSWFSTPLYPNLARQSAAGIDGVRMIVGKPGAQAKGLFDPKSVATFAARSGSLPFDVVCLSAGGNDLLSDRLVAIFKPWHEAKLPKISAAAAFDRVVASNAFDRLLDRYVLVLDALKSLKKSERPRQVIGHSYLPLVRIGQKGGLDVGNIGLIAILKGDVGPWLFGPMTKVLQDAAEAKKFADLLLIDGFKKTVLDALVKRDGGFFRYADLSKADLSDPNDWYDEIHPTGQGFAKCKAVLNAEIAAALPDKADKIEI